MVTLLDNNNKHNNDDDPSNISIHSSSLFLYGCRMSHRVLSTLHTLSPFILIILQDIDKSSILQVGTLRFREVKEFIQGHTAIRGSNETLNLSLQSRHLPLFRRWEERA